MSETRNNYSSGFDNIPLNFINSVTENITSSEVNIINSSINKEIFPDSWKVPRLCPVPKIDNPINEEDSQPISILPAVSKIYENGILKQLSDCRKSTSIYKSTQSGFRKGQSVQTIFL